MQGLSHALFVVGEAIDGRNLGLHASCPIQKNMITKTHDTYLVEKNIQNYCLWWKKNIQNYCQATSFLFSGFFLMSSTKSVMSPNMHRSGKLAATYLCTSV